MRHLSWLLAASFLAAPVVSARPPSEDLAAKAQRGKAAMAAGRFAEAATLYSEIVQALPEEPGMLLNLGMALSMAGRAREALPRLEAALRLRPDLLPAALFLGSTCLELGQPARAVEPLQKVVAAQSDNQEARRMLADVLLSLERLEPAVRQFRELTERAPRDPRAWYGLGRSYQGIARRAFEDLQRTAPESHYLSLLVAEAMASEGRHANAFRLYREALQQRPGLGEAHEALARIYEEKGHVDWAAVERQKARRIPPPDCRSPSLECDFRAERYSSILTAERSSATAEGLYWRSRAAHELARAAFGRLGELPPSPEATLLRVEVLQAQRQPFREAIEELRKAMKAWPGDLRLRRELGTALYLANDPEGALPILEDLAKREPDSPELAFLLGETLLKAQQAARAVPMLERAIRSDPKMLPAQAALGRAYLEVGEAEKAIAPLLAALPTDKDGRLHYQLSRAYRATGRAELASQALQAFQEIQRSAEAEARSLEEEFRITPP